MSPEINLKGWMKDILSDLSFRLKTFQAELRKWLPA
jgi:hypothetical protein